MESEVKEISINGVPYIPKGSEGKEEISMTNSVLYSSPAICRTEIGKERENP